jgi:aldose 1-epimerase
MSEFVPSTEKELLLTHGEHRVLLSTWGASLRRYYRLDPQSQRERDMLWGYSGTANKKGGQGDVLIPFPGRVQAGRYHFEGQEFELPRNDKDGPNAIHGFVRSQLWQLTHQTDTTARFRFRLEAAVYRDRGYPFTLEIELTYVLGAQGLVCECRIQNLGTGNAPVGVGFHPYFVVGTASIDEAEVMVPANRLVEFGTDLLPTGQLPSVDGTPWDFRAPKLIGKSHFNHCYTDMIRDSDGMTRIVLRNPTAGNSLVVWMDGAYSYLVVYTGDTIPAPHARQALAIEPMTCATDAFNHPGWGLMVLAPGEIFKGRFGITEGTP